MALRPENTGRNNADGDGKALASALNPTLC